MIGQTSDWYLNALSLLILLFKTFFSLMLSEESVTAMVAADIRGSYWRCRGI